MAYSHPVTGELVISDKDGGVYRLYDSGLELARYDFVVSHIAIKYEGQLIDVVEMGGVLQRKQAWNLDLTYVAENGEHVELTDIDKEVVRQHMYLRGDEEVVMFRRKMPDGIYYLYLYQEDASSIKSKSYDDFGPDEAGCVNEVCYTYDTDSRTLSLLDENLDTVWEFQALGEKAPIAGANYRLFPFKNTIVANLSADHGDWGDEGSKNGRVYGLNRLDGTVVWERAYEYQINDIALIDERRFVATSCNQLLVLNPENGDVIQAIDTGVSTRDSEGKLLDVDLYMISTECYILVYNIGVSAVFQFYNKKTLERLHQFDCRDFGFKLNGGLSRAYQLNDNKLFLEAVHTDGSEAYLDNLFMIDLDDIYSPVEVEVGPGFDIHLPDEDNSALELCVEGAEWQEIVRFAERHIIRNLIFVGRGELNEVGDPFFNAVVKLIIKNCPSPRDVLEEKLKVMDDRLKWFFKDKWALHDEPVTVEYIIE